MARLAFCKRFLLCGAIILLVVSFSNNALSMNGVVKIGLNYPETGPYAKQGLDQKRGAEIAAEEINASGGILGKKIELVLRDTKSNAKLAKGNAEELYDRVGVPMIFGGSSSAVAIATGEEALQMLK